MMICRYELTVRAICPIHKVIDVYEATIESPHQVIVETLLDFVKHLEETQETQEQITGTLARKFPGCRIVTVGYHSGVKTTVEAP